MKLSEKVTELARIKGRSMSEVNVVESVPKNDDMDKEVNDDEHGNNDNQDSDTDIDAEKMYDNNNANDHDTDEKETPKTTATDNNGATTHKHKRTGRSKSKTKKKLKKKQKHASVQKKNNSDWQNWEPKVMSKYIEDWLLQKNQSTSPTDIDSFMNNIWKKMDISGKTVLEMKRNPKLYDLFERELKTSFQIKFAVIDALENLYI